MSEQVWSEWIEHKPGDPCPIPWAQAFEWVLRHAGGEVNDIQFPALPDLGWEAAVNGITHYRYRLDRAPAGFVPPGQLWYPDRVPGFGPWVEHRPGPLRLGRDGIVMYSSQREKKAPVNSLQRLPAGDGYTGLTIVAYCLKLEDQPTADEIEATQHHWSPEQDAADWEADHVEANRPMFSADEAGVNAGKWDRHNARAALLPATPAPPFMVGGVRSSDGLLTEWPVGDHRLGLW